MLLSLPSPPDSKGAPAWRHTSRSPVAMTALQPPSLWSIQVADVATGVAQQAWIADTGSGSVFREVVAANQLEWASDDRLVFPWEKDGWTHLYAVPASGGRAVLLTPGAFEVEHVALSPDRASIVYSSNQDDIDRRHIWKVAATGGPPTAVTRGADLEWTPVVTSDGRGIAFIRAGTRTPPRPVRQASRPAGSRPSA